jgi:GT2 family glycosyltransferase
MLVRRETYAQVGGLDEQFHMYSEETDWCFRIQKSGWKIYYLPDIHIMHIGGASTRQRRAEMVAQLNLSKIQFFSANYGAARASQLRSMLAMVFSVRRIASRSLSFVLPRPSSEKWRARSDVERLVRDACLQFDS